MHAMLSALVVHAQKAASEIRVRIRITLPKRRILLCEGSAS